MKTLRCRLAGLGITPRELAAEMFISQEVLLPFMDVVDIPYQILQLLELIEVQIEQISMLYVQNLHQATGDLSDKTVLLVKFMTNKELWKYVPESGDISLSCGIHRQILQRTQKKLEKLGIKTEIIKFSSLHYERWLSQAQVPDSSLAVARWAVEQQ